MKKICFFVCSLLIGAMASAQSVITNVPASSGITVCPYCGWGHVHADNGAANAANVQAPPVAPEQNYSNPCGKSYMPVGGIKNA